MNVLSAILRTGVILRHFVNSNVDDKGDYNLSGLFLRDKDIIKAERLISKGTIADVLDKFFWCEEELRLSYYPNCTSHQLVS